MSKWTTIIYIRYKTMWSSVFWLSNQSQPQRASWTGRNILVQLPSFRFLHCRSFSECCSCWMLIQRSFIVSTSVKAVPTTPGQSEGSWLSAVAVVHDRVFQKGSVLIQLLFAILALSPPQGYITCEYRPTWLFWISMKHNNQFDKMTYIHMCIHFLTYLFRYT